MGVVNLNQTTINKPSIPVEGRKEYIKQEPYVGDDGIYVPMNQFVPEGTASYYKMLMSKEIFVEAYNKWIKGDVNE